MGKAAPQKVTESTQGNPIAAGLVAFGVGALAATLIPETRAETEQLSKVAEPVREEVTTAGREVAENLKSAAQESATAVKESVSDAAQEVKTEGQQAVIDVSQEAKQTVTS